MEAVRLASGQSEGKGKDAPRHTTFYHLFVAGNRIYELTRI